MSSGQTNECLREFPFSQSHLHELGLCVFRISGLGVRRALLIPGMSALGLMSHHFLLGDLRWGKLGGWKWCFSSSSFPHPPVKELLWEGTCGDLLGQAWWGATSGFGRGEDRGGGPDSPSSFHVP